MDKEIFKSIKGYEGYFEVSNFGRVRSLDRTITYTNRWGSKTTLKKKGKILSTRINNMGYVMVDLKVNKEKSTKLLHRLVAFTFLENPNNYDQVDHIDGNKQNNNLNNLEWVSQSINIKRAYDNKINNITEEAKKRLSENVKGVSPKDRCKEVIQLDLNGNELNRYKSITEASKALNIDRATIRDAITGRRGAKTAKGYKWKFA